MDNHNMDSKMPESHYMNEDLVMTLQDCEAVCEHMTYHIMKMDKDCSDRATQEMLLRECADICGLTAKFAARNAIFVRSAAIFCADICEECGTECSRFPDRMSQHCAMICLNCAMHCRNFADMRRRGRSERRDY